MTVAGEPAKHDIFDGIDITWNRFPGGAAIGKCLAEAGAHFIAPIQPGGDRSAAGQSEKADARANWTSRWWNRKRRELDETHRACARVVAGRDRGQIRSSAGRIAQSERDCLESRTSSRPGGVGRIVDGIAQAKDSETPKKTQNSRRSSLQELRKFTQLEIKIPADSRCRSHIGCASLSRATPTRCRIKWKSGYPKIRRCCNAKFQVERGHPKSSRSRGRWFIATWSARRAS